MITNNFNSIVISKVCKKVRSFWEENINPNDNNINNKGICLIERIF